LSAATYIAVLFPLKPFCCWIIR